MPDMPSRSRLLEDSPSSRMRLADVMAELAESVGARHYLVVSGERGTGNGTAILASNWSFDTIRIIGLEAIASFAAEAGAGFGAAPAYFRPGSRTSPGPRDTLPQPGLLRRHGHAEIVALSVFAGRRCCHLVLSAPKTGSIAKERLGLAQLRCCYLLTDAAAALFPAAVADRLSERERECLYWVAEGKTTEEVSTILGVTDNTVNSYLTQAVRKQGASNRVMAVAVAVRAGMI